ncbi:hypothetical protein SAMN05421773_11962 [Streptomyces aidingensis]|uniref:Uncharacterized protein n=1 Tax=Streptomyces aidingensis TaxID=910347 RepID=A0A1I1TEQ3_9ACTN|nr:hypothetical protein SAMN05421773_11962 [Streptomyces aidingensis]
MLRALSDRQRTGGAGRVIRLSLAGTASWLLHGLSPVPPAGGGPPGPYDPGDPAPWLTVTGSPYGPLRHALPPVHYAGAPRTWDRPPSRWGTDPAVWR